MNTPVQPQIQRTLAAVVVTDAVGFSKHMSQDEDKALAMISRDLQLICELCEFFEGQILKTVGDGALMYFVSAVQAAACAIEIQKTFAGFALNGRADEHFTHRVGVHLGDIFFNQQDMMGTGVNIAARLEAAAKPGAVCMSQVVYDVVKSRLPFDAVYAGELPLKNIEEAVAAYHVWPLGMRSSEETTEAVAPLTITPINAALKAFSEHPNNRRIKKLLFGTHNASWENDSSVLERSSLRLLIESLTNRNTTLEDCRTSLYQTVATLNRQEEYAQVAEIILENLQAFYGPDTSSPAPVLLKDPMEALYQDIADRLDQMSEKIRIKKVIYCMCYDSWEDDSDRILQIKTITLIVELYRQITTIQGLQNRLRAILLRLNRKTKYAPIANLIFAECQILYPEGDGQISMPGEVEIEDLTGDNTQINLREKPPQRWGAAKQPSDLGSNASDNPPILMRSTAFGK
jgi:adenylate cyclase